MPNEREEGLAALQSKDFQTAQAKLETAVQQNPQDGQAYLYLGGVYHQVGRHAEALQALTRATELMPSSPQARYNLGIVQEHQGDSAQALSSYQQAIALQGNYPLAQQGVERMQKAVAGAPAAPAYAPAPPVYGQQPSYGQANAETPTGAYPGAVSPAAPYAQTQPMAAQPYAAPQPPPAYGQPPQPTGYAQPQAYDLAGNPLPNAQPAYGQQYAPGGPAGPTGYQGPQWVQNGVLADPVKEDVFSIGQSFSDFIALLFSPREFFAEEEGASGFSAPLSMLLAYSLIAGLIYCVGVLWAASSAGAAALIALLGVLLIVPIVYIVYILGGFIWAGLVHGVSRLFGGNGAYSGTFRAVVYSWAPTVAMGCITGIIGLIMTPKPTLPTQAMPQGTIVRAQYNRPGPPSMPGGGFGGPRMGGSSFGRQGFGQPGFGGSGGPRTMSPYNSGMPGGAGMGQPGFGGYNSSYSSPYGTSRRSLGYPGLQSNPIGMVFNLIGFIWSLVLLGMGVRATQRMSSGGAIGTVIISGLVIVALFVALMFAMAGMIAALMMQGAR